VLDTLAGIPSHPLFVHAPVVLIPLVGLTAIALAFRPAWRATLRWWPSVAAGVSLIATLLAVGSGNAFDERLDGLVDTERHESLALTTLALVAVFFGATVAQRLLSALWSGLLRCWWSCRRAWQCGGHFSPARRAHASHGAA
jgi:hypothetical protein